MSTRRRCPQSVPFSSAANLREILRPAGRDQGWPNDETMEAIHGAEGNLIDASVRVASGRVAAGNRTNGCHSVWYTQRMTVQLAIRLPDDLICRLDSLIPEKHTTRSEAVRRAIELYLYRLACEHDAQLYERLPLTDSELALSDDPESWTKTPPW
jgi:hypothetical protein